MSAPGFTPISLYYSTTAAAAPSAGNLAAGELAVNITDGKLFYKDNGGVVRVLATAAGAAGDVVGPGSSTDNALVRFDGTTGKLVQNSVGVLDDSGNLTGLASLTATTLTGALTGTVGATTPNTGAFTTLSASGAVTLSGGTANGVAYLNGSKVLTTGSALTFDGSRLGVGTASPSYGVDVRGASGVGIQIFVTSAGNNNRLILTQQATVSTYNSTFSTGSGAHAWQLGGSEQMRLTSTGLGIGTSSPSAKLQVVDGNILLSNAYSLSARNAANTTSISLIQRNTSDQVVIDADGYGTKIGAGGALFLNGSGNLGLGVTPSAIGGGKYLQVLSTSSFGQQANGTANLMNNAYESAGNTFTYIVGAGAARYNVSAGVHSWYTAPSGTAGNAISFTQAMTLDASGSLLVGTTSVAIGNTGGFSFTPGVGSYNGVAIIGHSTSNISGSGFINFNYNGSAIGSISQNGTTAVLYNTTSDYRLKTVLGPVSDAGSRIDALEPVEYEWRVDGSRTRGFLAHKFQEVYAGSVSGSKDAVDKEGKPVYQAMQAGSSEVIADLVAEIQSLRKRLAAAGI